MYLLSNMAILGNHVSSRRYIPYLFQRWFPFQDSGCNQKTRRNKIHLRSNESPTISAGWTYTKKTILQHPRNWPKPPKNTLKNRRKHVTCFSPSCPYWFIHVFQIAVQWHFCSSNFVLCRWCSGINHPIIRPMSRNPLGCNNARTPFYHEPLQVFISIGWYEGTFEVGWLVMKPKSMKSLSLKEIPSYCCQPPNAWKINSESRGFLLTHFT